MSEYYKNEEIIIKRCEYCGREYKTLIRFDIGICGNCKIKMMENENINHIPTIE